MKQFKTALLAGAFALASTMAFAQAVPPVSGSAGTGAKVGATPGSMNGSANTGANVKAGGTKADVDANASDNTKIKKDKATTTGSGAAGVNGTVNTR